VNVWWRTLLTLMSARVLYRRRGPLPPDAVGRIRLRTLPTDIDLLGHMNNGRYASLFDLGRFDLLTRTGIWQTMGERGWYGVVASETVTFRKSLQLWQRFTVETRIIGHDDKSVFQMHRAVVDGEDGRAYDYPGLLWFAWRASLRLALGWAITGVNRWQNSEARLCTGVAPAVCKALGIVLPFPDAEMAPPHELYRHLRKHQRLAEAIEWGNAANLV